MKKRKINVAETNIIGNGRVRGNVVWQYNGRGRQNEREYIERVRTTRENIGIVMKMSETRVEGIRGGQVTKRLKVIERWHVV